MSQVIPIQRGSDSYSWASHTKVFLNLVLDLLDLLLELVELLVLVHCLVGGNQLVASHLEVLGHPLLAAHHAEVLGCRATARAVLLGQLGVNHVQLVDEVVVGDPGVLRLVAAAHWAYLPLRLLSAKIVREAVHLGIEDGCETAHEHCQHAWMELSLELLSESSLVEEHALVLRLLTLHESRTL